MKECTKIPAFTNLPGAVLETIVKKVILYQPKKIGENILKN